MRCAMGNDNPYAVSTWGFCASPDFVIAHPEIGVRKITTILLQGDYNIKHLW